MRALLNFVVRFCQPFSPVAEDILAPSRRSSLVDGQELTFFCKSCRAENVMDLPYWHWGQVTDQPHPPFAHPPIASHYSAAALQCTRDRCHLLKQISSACSPVHCHASTKSGTSAPVVEDQSLGNRS